MKRLFIVILVILGGHSYAQEQEVSVKLAEDVTLMLVKATFDPKGKTIEILEGVAASIDQHIVFGTDGEMPRTFLKKATLVIGVQTFDLQVDGMYNPWHEEYFNEKAFQLIREGRTYKVQGAFSDGAGYYGVEWVVHGQGCIRTILTNDEKILYEYMEQ